MALVQYGGGVLDMRGSIGGQVHARNRYGNYVRARTTPVNPQSQAQNLVRTIIQTLSRAWSGDLTQLQRDAWEVYAAAITRVNKLGAQVKLTGFNHFIRSNAFILQNGGSRVDAGPVSLTLPGADPTFAAEIDVAGQEIAVTFDDSLAWANEVGGHMGIYMSLPRSSATNFIAGPYRLAGTIDGAVSPPSSPDAIAVPFPVGLGQQVKVKARIVESDGRLSDPFFDQSSVVAG